MEAIMVPPLYDVIWSTFALASVVLLLAALVRWGRDRHAVGGLGVLWLLILLFVPVVGPAAYLVTRTSPAKQ
jgi:hypothetical protein